MNDKKGRAMSPALYSIEAILQRLAAERVITD